MLCAVDVWYLSNVQCVPNQTCVTTCFSLEVWPFLSQYRCLKVIAW